MNQAKCPRCMQPISAGDTIAFDGDRIVHVDCQRPRGLSHEERALLFRYCFDHAVADCVTCRAIFRLQELGSDVLGGRTNLCPRCRADLTESARSHVYECELLPAEVQRRAREVRAAAQKVVKRSQQLVDHADVLVREAEAATAALRETMRRYTSGR